MPDETTTGRRGRGGRPPSADPRTRQVMVRLTVTERARLDELAGPRGIAEYLRACGLRRRARLPRLVPEVNATAWRDLAPAMANLNQLARHANEGRIVGGPDLAPVLDAVRDQVMSLRAALLGQERDEEDPP